MKTASPIKPMKCWIVINTTTAQIIAESFGFSEKQSIGAFLEYANRMWKDTRPWSSWRCVGFEVIPHNLTKLESSKDKNA